MAPSARHIRGVYIALLWLGLIGSPAVAVDPSERVALVTCQKDFLALSHQVLWDERRFQQRIWLLQEKGDEPRANRNKARVERWMRRHMVGEPEALPGSSSHPVKAHLDSEIGIVFKKDENKTPWSSPEREEIAYIFDSLLDLNVVPIAFRRKLRGEWGVAQFFVEAEQGQIDFRPGSSHPYFEGFEHLFILDFMLGNRDRKGANWLITPLGRIVAIDHGDLYKPDRPSHQEPLTDYIHSKVPVRREIIEKLSRLTRKRLLEAFGDLADDRFLDFVMAQKKRLLPRLVPIDE